MQIKTIDWNQPLYHLFKLNNISYVLFDDKMDMPIKYGALNDVTPIIESLRKYIKNVYVVYYDRNFQDKMSFKMNLLKTSRNNDKSTKEVLPVNQTRKV